MLKVLINLLLALSVAACGSHDKDVYQETPMGVELSKQSSPSVKIQVNETQKSSYLGPHQENSAPSPISSAAPEPVLALHFALGEGGLKNSLGFVRQLQKHGIKARIYSGVGEGAVLAVLLAFNLTPDEIEWKLFAFERDKDKQLLNLLEDFEAKKLEHSFHVLALPSGQNHWHKKGNLHKILAQHLASPLKLDQKPNKAWLNADLFFVVNLENQSEQIKNIMSAITTWKAARTPQDARNVE